MDSPRKLLRNTFGLITLQGDDGHGCYAGIAITIARLVRIPIFWIDFFAQDEAKIHDLECDCIDWSDADKAYNDYKRVTWNFYIACLTKAQDVPQLIWDSQIAYWFAMRFGDFRYELARK